MYICTSRFSKTSNEGVAKSVHAFVVLNSIRIEWIKMVYYGKIYLFAYYFRNFFFTKYPFHLCKGRAYLYKACSDCSSFKLLGS